MIVVKSKRNAVCDNCGKPIRLILVAETEFYARDQWVHEDGNLYCEPPKVAHPRSKHCKRCHEYGCRDLRHQAIAVCCDCSAKDHPNMSKCTVCKGDRTSMRTSDALFGIKSKIFEEVELEDG